MSDKLLKEMDTQLPQIVLVLTNTPLIGWSSCEKSVLHLTHLYGNENDLTWSEPQRFSGLQTTASTSNLWMMIANKQQQNQFLAENSVQRWCLHAFTLPSHVEKNSYYSTEKNEMVRDRKARRAASAK